MMQTEIVPLNNNGQVNLFSYAYLFLPYSSETDFEAFCGKKQTNKRSRSLDIGNWQITDHEHSKFQEIFMSIFQHRLMTRT